MSIFDLFFLLAVLGTLVSLVVAAVLAVAQRWSASLRLLRGLALSLAGYLLVGLGVSLVRPRRVLSVGEPWCFDDWCLTVENVSATPRAAGLTYQVGLRISSRARRISQRARGAWIYVLDDQGRRYAPERGASDAPLDVLLGPGESVSTSRSFPIPPGVRPVGLVTGHGGPYCGLMSFLIVGASGCVFGKPPMVRFP